MQRLVSILSVFCILLLLEACGFRLRGVYAFPQEMQQTHVMVDGEVDADIRRTIIENLGSSGIEVVDSRASATAIMTISEAITDREIVSRDNRGRPQQYSMTAEIEFSVETAGGRKLINPVTVTAQADITLDATDPLSSNREADNALLKLKESVVRKMLRRIEGAASAQE